MNDNANTNNDAAWVVDNFFRRMFKLFMYIIGSLMWIVTLVIFVWIYLINFYPERADIWFKFWTKFLT